MSEDAAEEQVVEGGLDEPTDLEPEQGSLELAAPEDRHDRAAWEAAAAAVLRKARRLGPDDPDDAVWSALTRTTLDGIGLTPLGVPEDLERSTTAGRPTRAGAWDVRAHLALGDDPALDNQAVLADLEGGATSVHLSTTQPPDWAPLLDGVFLDLAPVVLEGGAAVAESFLAHVDAEVDVDLHPGTNLGVDAREATPDLAAAATRAGVLAFVVDAAAVHDRGASEVQELAHSLAVAVGYLRRMEAAGVGLDEAVALLEFRYAATDEQFTTIAKLRAARRLWARVLEVCEAAPALQRQHAVTSRAVLSKYDPYVNLLRTTVAAFAAGVGGADAVTVLSFDTPLGRPDAFARRIARNTNALLVEEAHLAVVADPAGGAYAVERLTDDLALAAWELFGELDDSADPDALLEAAIAATVAERDEQVATRKRPITGLSEFPDLAETLPERAPSTESREVRRHGAAFEALRDEPARRTAYLATLGTVAAHTARATFATNLLAAGGIGVDLAGATSSAAELTAAYDGQPVVCLAGTDAAYDEWGAEAADALRSAGAHRVVVAGRPRDWADDSCAVGIDAIAFLTRTREALS